VATQTEGSTPLIPKPANLDEPESVPLTPMLTAWIHIVHLNVILQSHSLSFKWTFSKIVTFFFSPIFATFSAHRSFLNLTNN
jgi:hypothetical protein